MLNEKMILKIANKYGTPLYLYDLRMVDFRLKQLKECFNGNAELLYSIKANPNRDIITYLSNKGIGFEVSSFGELKLLVDMAIDAQKIVFSGPYKTKEAIDFAIKNNIFSIDVESIEELKNISEISKKQNVVSNISLRINPMINCTSTGIKMTGIASQFGFEQKDLEKVFSFIKTSHNLSFIGVHIYFGTQILNEKDILDNIQTIFDLCKDIVKRYGVKMQYINFGGGFGIPYFNNESDLDISILKKEFANIFWKNREFLLGVKCFFESGRFLVADCGSFITSVVYRKTSKNENFIVCDGGSNFHANSAFLGRFVRRNYPVECIKTDEHCIDAYEKCTVTGPLCTATDIIAQNVYLPICKEGDLIVIKKSGAYGITNSPILFIMHKMIKEIILDENNNICCSESLKENIKLVCLL